MIQKIKDLCRQPSQLELITKELAIAHLDKLEAETAVDYAKSVVDYNIARIERLNKYLETQESAK
jgi:hypothetical protein